MKNRIGFVSNSSSSSFVVKKEGLTEEQLNILRDPLEFYNYVMGSFDLCDQKDVDSWEIKETDEVIARSTWMDNFDFIPIVLYLELPKKNIIELGRDDSKNLDYYEDNYKGYADGFRNGIIEDVKEHYGESESKRSINKDVCINCYKKEKIKCGISDYFWDRGVCICPYPSKVENRSFVCGYALVKSSPPSWCPYVLEHTLKTQNG